MNDEAKKFCVHNRISINPSVVSKDFIVKYYKDGELSYNGLAKVSFPTQHTQFSSQINLDLDSDIFHVSFSDKWQNINFNTNNNTLTIVGTSKSGKPYKILIHGNN